MKKFFLFLLILFLYNCSKPKTVFICGDHVCINKKEADQYFEENLTIEVKIINAKTKKDIDLVELNMSNNLNEKKVVTIKPKTKVDKNLRTLSNEDVIMIKKDIKNYKKEKKIAKKIIKEKEKNINKKKNSLKIKELKKDEFLKNSNNKNNGIIDVCKILKKCNIEEISKYLLEEGNKKKYPDITKIQ